MKSVTMLLESFDDLDDDARRPMSVRILRVSCPMSEAECAHPRIHE